MNLSLFTEKGANRHRHKWDQFVETRQVFVGACSLVLGAQFDSLFDDDEERQAEALPYQMWTLIKEFLTTYSEHYAQVPRLKDSFNRVTLDDHDDDMKAYLNKLVDLKKALNGYKDNDYSVTDNQATQKAISGIRGATNQDHPYFYTCNEIQNKIEAERRAIIFARANNLPVPKKSMTFLVVQNLVLTRYKEIQQSSKKDSKSSDELEEAANLAAVHGYSMVPTTESAAFPMMRNGGVQPMRRGGARGDRATIGGFNQQGGCHTCLSLEHYARSCPLGNRFLNRPNPANQSSLQQPGMGAMQQQMQVMQQQMQQMQQQVNQQQTELLTQMMKQMMSDRGSASGLAATAAPAGNAQAMMGTIRNQTTFNPADVRDDQSELSEPAGTSEAQGWNDDASV
mmetsp:Transcript_43811/g.71509  ORF Transcript_43811/g.71509 Transcript_43811/m.71509 type:complete len:397 (-) Transcript_43811:169-1359(-)